MRVEYCNYELIRRHIAEALVVSGLAKETSIKHLAGDIKALERYLTGRDRVCGPERAERIERHLARGKSLGRARTGSGHDCFLKGIVVTAVVSAPAYQWPQIQRYHFQDITTSQSKMHRITKFDLKEMCNPEVDEIMIARVKMYVDRYNQVNDALGRALNEAENSNFIKELQDTKDYYFRKIINNAPQGLRLAAGITTNYLQLKTQHYQRKDHKLTEWNTDFIDWLEELPYFFEYIGVER